VALILGRITERLRRWFEDWVSRHWVEAAGARNIWRTDGAFRRAEIHHTATGFVRKANRANDRAFCTSHHAIVLTAAGAAFAATASRRCAIRAFACGFATRVALFCTAKWTHTARAQQNRYQSASCGKRPPRFESLSGQGMASSDVEQTGLHAQSDTHSSIVKLTGTSYAIATTCVTARVEMQAKDLAIVRRWWRWFRFVSTIRLPRQQRHGLQKQEERQH
jgi:hypothetical protein